MYYTMKETGNAVGFDDAYFINFFTIDSEKVFWHLVSGCFPCRYFVTISDIRYY